MFRLALLTFCLLSTGAMADTAGYYVFPDANNTLNPNTYDCEVKEGYVLQPDGTLVRDHWVAREIVIDKGPFRFNAGSGVMSFERPDVEDMRWTILHPGDERFTLIAHIPYIDPMYRTFRLETWNFEGIVFTWTEGTDVFSGSCSKLER